jgi:hypothetical protein
MKCAVEMGSGAIIYVPSFMNIDSGVKKEMKRGMYRHTDSLEIA